MERTFDERLSVSLTLTIAGKAHEIIAGSIKRFSLELWSWGLEGEVEFLLTDNSAQGGKEKDALLADFIKPDLVEVSLEVKAVLAETSARPSHTALTVKGLVTEKTLVEEVVPTASGATVILHRRYGIRFLDAARVLWRQHFPCALYTSKTLKDVLEEHKGDKISLAYDWDAGLGTSHSLIFVGLDPQRGASFYDWVLWYVHGHMGVWTYDYAAHGYKFAAAKDSSGTPLKLVEENLQGLEVLLPEVIRHDVTVLNATAESPQTQPVTQKQAVAGIRQDVLLCTPISDEVQARVDLETARLKWRGPEMELVWRSFPEKTFTPGALVKLPDNAAWSAAGLAAGEPLRIRSLHVSGEVSDEQGQEEVYNDPSALFSFRMSTRLERKDDPHVDLPAWQPPAYPRYVEGFIVSEQGADKDETWQAYTDSKTSLDGYKVKIPLFADQIIPAPFNPNLLPGHFYFPAYKGERVLVALGFQNAWIKRFLDWRTGARMPQDGQGVQLLVGKTPENGTALKHFYTDDKPVFLMQRTNAKDTQKIQLDEGTLLIQVKEEQS
ncbi:hypothetical protein ATI61_101812 [Archangium gephyra]|uniref:Uncharacterized protein n=1 Tax=Archangium gephyra TaxID=48 RepID=A0AAC8TFK9_9BACT|nr:hypothetical protein [Archangium gephyra]AKJ04093.1 Hypothetical protein AA314_05719 [Archangium gephyra]REG37825.1 hypothetical protein ATI61_101812 [Archangium gephyra]